MKHFSLPEFVSRRRWLLLGLFAAVGAGVALMQGYGRRPLAEIAAKTHVLDFVHVRRVKERRDVLRRASEESGVDPNLLGAVMVTESSGRIDAKSNKGALGLFQLMPITANWRAEKLGLPKPTEKELLSDAWLNARLGADNLAWLLGLYDGNVEQALVAYNLGPTRLAEYVEKAGGWSAWRAERKEAGDSQLLAYAAKVLAYRDLFRDSRVFADDK